MRKYNLSKIMKRAWELVKTAAVTMSAALKTAWAEAKASCGSISEKLLQNGFKAWEKGTLQRIYINPAKVGYEWEVRRSGSINNAMLNGQWISNSEMCRVLAAKCYVDVTDNSIHGTYSAYTDVVKAFIATL